MTSVVVAIFGLTYALIASRRLRLLPIGRPAGALLGALLMVAVGALTPAAAYQAIDGDTILLLFGMMLLTAWFGEVGLLDDLAARGLRLANRPGSLLVTVALLAAGLSAMLVNDTVCVFLTPLVLAVCRAGRLPPGPYLIALATSANIGSAATLVGNPQNMIIGSLSGLPFSTFLLRAGPPALVGLAVNVGLLWLWYGRRLRRSAAESPVLTPPAAPRGRPRDRLLALVVLAGVLVAFLAGLHLGWTAVAGALVFLLVRREDPHRIFARVDWPLLVFFCALFIVVEGLVSTGLVADAWRGAAPALDPSRPGGVTLLTGFLTVGSNVVSNVPMTLLAGPYLETLGLGDTGWVLLAYVTTVAGNLTLLGSVANIIVAETAREEYTLGFFEYLRFGFVSTVVALAVGVPVVFLVA
jgi:Na+/H+ antiporter NhaD/arsenite permease-like protein